MIDGKVSVAFVEEDEVGKIYGSIMQAVSQGASQVVLERVSLRDGEVCD